MATAWARAVPAWHRLRYSYAAVLAAVAVGVLAPGWAGRVLGPLLLPGLVLLGVAHGACDQLVLPATHPALARHRGRYWVVFLGGYLGLAAAVGALWWWQPARAAALFLALSAWHWGSGDAPAATRYRSQWLAHSLLRGALIFAVPLLAWPAATTQVLGGLLALAGAAPVPVASVAATGQWLGPAVLAGLLALWGSYAATGQAALAGTDALETLLLLTLLTVLPPVLSAGVYFVGWHSLQHVLRLNALLSRSPQPGRPLWVEVGFFLKKAAPLLALSMAALAALYGWEWARAAAGPVLLSLTLLVASVVTLPHALLVTLALDAGRRRSHPGQPPAAS